MPKTCSGGQTSRIFSLGYPWSLSFQTCCFGPTPPTWGGGPIWWTNLSLVSRGEGPVHQCEGAPCHSSGPISFSQLPEEQVGGGLFRQSDSPRVPQETGRYLFKPSRTSGNREVPFQNSQHRSSATSAMDQVHGDHSSAPIHHGG